MMADCRKLQQRIRNRLYMRAERAKRAKDAS